MVRKVVLAITVVALVATGCSKKAEKTGDGGSKTNSYTVQVDAHKPGDDVGIYAAHYYPRELSAHAGDTIDFKLNWSGEPHSVTFGTLVDAGVPKLDPKADDEPAELQKIPHMLPEGPGDALQAAVNPCFLDSGDPPLTGPCPEGKSTQPAFNGKYSFYNSGFLPEGATFSVKLASDLPAGEYYWFCNLHRGIMTGELKVVAASESVESPDKVAAEGEEQISELKTTLKAAADQAKKAQATGTVNAGAGDPKLIETGTDAGVVEFFPNEISVAAGAQVKWLPSGPHTISFNPPQDAVEFITKAPDGAFHLNAKAAGPAGSPPTGPPGEKPIVTDAGTWNGEGFFSSGLLLGFGPPGSLAWQVKFSKAGTYEYRCLIHPDMEGTVKVS